MFISVKPSTARTYPKQIKIVDNFVNYVEKKRIVV